MPVLIHRIEEQLYEFLMLKSSLKLPDEPSLEDDAFFESVDVDGGFDIFDINIFTFNGDVMVGIQFDKPSCGTGFIFLLSCIHLCPPANSGFHDYNLIKVEGTR